MAAPVPDNAALRKAFAHVPSAVVAICADTGSERIGIVASTFMPVSLDPPLVAFCIQNTSTTWPRLAQSRRLGISVLSDSHDKAVLTLSAKNGDRFADVETETHDGGALFISGCGLILDASIEYQLPVGDHTIVVLRINELHCLADSGHLVEPIVFHRSGFRRLVAS